MLAAGNLAPVVVPPVADEGRQYTPHLATGESIVASQSLDRRAVPVSLRALQGMVTTFPFPQPSRRNGLRWYRPREKQKGRRKVQ